MSGTTPPVAARRPVRSRWHGRELVDEYAWLRDRRWQEAMADPARLDPAIRAHLEAENAWTEAVMAPLDRLRRRLYEEMRARVPERDASVPLPDGPWAYFLRFDEGAEYPVHCRCPRAGGAEDVLLDEPREAGESDYYDVADAVHSPDHRFYAWSVDRAGDEVYTIHIREPASGRLLPDRLEGARGDMAWAADSRTLYYTELDARHRPLRVRRHRLGEPAEADELVYEEEDPRFSVGVDVSEDRRYIVIHASDHSDTSEVHLLDARDPAAEARCFAARRAGVSYDPGHVDGRFVILTNDGGAVDFRIMMADAGDTRPCAWRELVPHVPGRLITDMVVLRRHVLRLELRDAVPRIVVHRLADASEHEVDTGAGPCDLELEQGFEFDTTVVRYTSSSPADPERTREYDVERRTSRLLKTRVVPSGHDPDHYVVERFDAASPDGARVPVTVLCHRDTPRDGTAPCLLYGYGAYGIAVPDEFDTDVLSLVDRGFVHAVAHVRGGTERGYRWYLDGKLAGKHRSFDDFIAAAQALVSGGWTRAGAIAAYGASAGGMLVAVAANRHPGLFGAILAEVPFVDVLNTMCDESLPLTPPEWDEWGNPLEDAAAFDRIRAWCPYQNVTGQPYPPVFATAGISDARVTWWEPAKWVARLRANSTGDGPILLRTNLGAGHGGASGRFASLEETAWLYAFTLGTVGIGQPRLAASRAGDAH